MIEMRFPSCTVKLIFLRIFTPSKLLKRDPTEMIGVDAPVLAGSDVMFASADDS